MTSSSNIEQQNNLIQQLSAKTVKGLVKTNLLNSRKLISVLNSLNGEQLSVLHVKVGEVKEQVMAIEAQQKVKAAKDKAQIDESIKQALQHLESQGLKFKASEVRTYLSENLSVDSKNDDQTQNLKLANQVGHKVSKNEGESAHQV